MGAVVSEYFVLTAAHCFTVDDQKHSIKVSLGKDDATNQFGAPALSSAEHYPLAQEPSLPFLNIAPSFAPWTS